MGYLINNALVEGKKKDILILGDRIAWIKDSFEPLPGRDDSEEAIEVIDAEGFAALPSLVNAHAHSPMALLRGIAEDQELLPWLTETVWPLEARYEREDVYWGYRLAALEMIKGGITFCNDMYADPLTQGQAARDAGIRAIISYPLMDGMDAGKAAVQRKACKAFFDTLPDYGPLVRFGIAAHSVYVTSPESLVWGVSLSRERKLFFHVHVAETEGEERDCRLAHGLSSVAYLKSLGALHERTTAAHCVWCTPKDFELLAEAKSTVAHNPVSNMKLASGVFDYQEAKARGVRVLLGTDGAASNNSLDLFSDMKIAGLLQKVHFRDPKRFPVSELLSSASAAGHAFYETGGGKLEAGAAADLILVDIRGASLVPVHDLAANLVYAASSEAVDTSFCAGRMIMRHRRVPGEEEVLAEATSRARGLSSRGRHG